MKPFKIVLLIIFLFQCSSGFGQTLSFNSSVANPNDIFNARGTLSSLKQMHKHCALTYIGGSLLTAGCVVVAVSAIGIASAQSASEQDASKQIVYGFVGLCGLSLVGTGLGLFIAGKHHDRDRGRRFSIISNQKQLGLAYNF